MQRVPMDSASSLIYDIPHQTTSTTQPGEIGGAINHSIAERRTTDTAALVNVDSSK
jgi:hypothetical protein